MFHLHCAFRSSPARNETRPRLLFCSDGLHTSGFSAVTGMDNKRRRINFSVYNQDHRELDLGWPVRGRPTRKLLFRPLVWALSMVSIEGTVVLTAFEKNRREGTLEVFTLFLGCNTSAFKGILMVSAGQPRTGEYIDFYSSRMSFPPTHGWKTNKDGVHPPPTLTITEECTDCGVCNLSWG